MLYIYSIIFWNNFQKRARLKVIVWLLVFALLSQLPCSTVLTISQCTIFSMTFGHFLAFHLLYTILFHFLSLICINFVLFQQNYLVILLTFSLWLFHHLSFIIWLIYYHIYNLSIYFKSNNTLLYILVEFTSIYLYNNIRATKIIPGYHWKEGMYNDTKFVPKTIRRHENTLGCRHSSGCFRHCKSRKFHEH